MKILRLSLPSIALALTFCVSVIAAPTTDFAAALKTAAAENKPILLEFTGSDWCPPCMMMKKEILSQDAFKSFADDKLVSVELDFPRAKEQSPELVKQNDELQSKFKVEGYPTFILLDSGGKELGRTVGFMAGGPSAFIDWIKSTMGKS
jgi:thioredoxin-related protein